MSDIVIQARDLGKKYTIGHNPLGNSNLTFREAIIKRVKGFSNRTIDILRTARAAPGAEYEDFWALHDVSFDIKRGEVVGIIGRNGAGKSTLLKILSRIVEPTKGRVDVTGRVASLLEVGTGFHPELTGRENIFLNGAILGMRRAEIKKLFDEIVDFAGIERFLDTPVKRYSSGMYVRLAFAVAAHLEPQILIVDEVLAVGDAEFQKKCMGKMEDVVHGLGRTVLLVSHNLSAIRALCTKGILLNNGGVEFVGSSHEAVNAYASTSEGAAPKARRINNKNPTIISAEIDEKFANDGDLKVNVRVFSPILLAPLMIGVVITNRLGTPVFGINNWKVKEISVPAGGYATATLIIPNLALHSGPYNACIYLGERSEVHDYYENAATFNFVAPESLPPGVSQETVGSMRVSGDWKIAVEN